MRHNTNARLGTPAYTRLCAEEVKTLSSWIDQYKSCCNVDGVHGEKSTESLTAWKNLPSIPTIDRRLPNRYCQPSEVLAVATSELDAATQEHTLSLSNEGNVEPRWDEK